MPQIDYLDNSKSRIELTADIAASECRVRKSLRKIAKLSKSMDKHIRELQGFTR